MKIDLVILAAGYARRFHGNKLLHVWQGKPILAHVMVTCQQVDFHAIHVVSQYEEVLALAHTRGMHAVKNDHPQKGMSSSLQLGQKAAKDADAIVFLTGDMPKIKAETLQKLCHMADAQHIICAAVHGAIRNPMLFPSCWFSEFNSLVHEEGGKTIAMRHQEACILMEVNEAEVQDIDTREDLQQFDNAIGG